MKRIKKLLSVFLAMTMVMTLPVYALASTIPSNDLYIQTLVCPSDIIDYASENVVRLVQSMDENYALNYDELYVGHPFTYGNNMSNLFTFPIIYCDEIMYTLRVAYTPEGDICGTASTFLVDYLNSYIGKTSFDVPLLFDVSGNKLYAYCGDKCETVYTFPEDQINEAMAAASSLADFDSGILETVNITETENFGLNWRAARDPMKYLKLTFTGFQSGGKWCAAYVTATILSTVKHTEYIVDYIANYCHITSPGRAFTLEQCTDYAQNIAELRSTTYTYSGLTKVELMQQIDMNLPVYYGVGNGDINHALVLRGYNLNNMTWSVWDPTNGAYTYEAFPMDGSYLTSTGLSLNYNGHSIYNFKP